MTIESNYTVGISLASFSNNDTQNQNQSHLVPSILFAPWPSQMYLLGILIGSSYCLLLLGLVQVTTLQLVLRKTTFIKLIGAYYVIPLC